MPTAGDIPKEECCRLLETLPRRRQLPRRSVVEDYCWTQLPDESFYCWRHQLPRRSVR